MLPLITKNIKPYKFYTIPIRWKHYKKTIHHQDFMGNKTSQTIEWDAKKFPNVPPPNQQENMMLFLKSATAFINTVVKEWNSNPQLREKVRETTYSILDKIKRLSIGPPPAEKEQYRRIEIYNSEQRLLLLPAVQKNQQNQKILNFIFF